MKRIFIMGIVFIIFLFFIYFLYYINIIPHRKYDNNHFNIETYISNNDRDNDAVDDQTDFLNGVLEYISTKPKYKSKYYANGYPDDEYGVCVDVVNFGLLKAGYDIKMLLNEDILNNKDVYNIKTIDKNIDFRRVNNLNIYLKRHAISLTTDLKNIEEWQGGDIVVFNRHIGVISNMRNYKGIPFLIHHESSYQLKYEEDKLELMKDDIIGHYRIS